MHLPACLLLLVLSQAHAQSQQVKVVADTGAVEVVDTNTTLNYVDAPSISPPQVTANDTKVDCISSNDAFWGPDFLATTDVNTSSASDCCKACKLANDCTVWNWCGNDDGCTLPPNLASASGKTSLGKNTCLWKPRPVLYAGTLPLAPEANISGAMKGWTSGIPINGSLIPNLDGFNLTKGIEMDYSVENDFYCQGSTTSKPVCQLYGSAQGGAAACLNNPVCRGFQICWAYPVWGSAYQQSAIIRMKGGLGPLNTTAGLQNPYCSVYTIDDSIFNGSNSDGRAYALRSAYNGTQAAAYYQYAANNPSVDATLNSVTAAAASRATTSAPTNQTVSSSLGTAATGSSNNNRRRLQESVAVSGVTSSITSNGSNTQLVASPAIAVAAQSSPLSNTTATNRAGAPSIIATNFTTPYLDGTILQAFKNVTFNYTQCYSNAATIRVTLQQQLFPLLGPNPYYSIHSWIEKPFRSSATECCVFQDINDIFLNLENGVVAVAQQGYIATNPNITNAGPVRNYDTTPSSIATPVIYIPPGQVNTPGGYGRQYSFPRINSTAYIGAVEKLQFALSQILLGDQSCSLGFKQLGSAVSYLNDLLSSFADGDEESLGGIPTELEYLDASGVLNADAPATGCLIEEGAEFDGTILTTLTGNQTRESCCAACWFYTGENGAACDIWVLDTVQQSCELRNSTLAANFQPVDVLRAVKTLNLVSGRTTAIQPTNSTTIFLPQSSRL